MGKQVVGLLDADIIAFAACSSDEDRWDFGDFECATNNWEAVKKRMDAKVDELCNQIKSTRPVICLSDPNANFRKSIYPKYKDNRKSSVRPELLLKAKKYLADNYESYFMPKLEADDVMGILATNAEYIKGDKVIVSEDKDMRTIPAKVFNPNQAHLGILKISKLEAQQFHLWQTIVGDQTDGYPGAKGVGKASDYAIEILQLTDPIEMWDTVLLAYASKGLTEEDALVQARCARILWSDDWDSEKKLVKKWTPLCLYW